MTDYIKSSSNDEEGMEYIFTEPAILSIEEKISIGEQINKFENKKQRHVSLEYQEFDEKEENNFWANVTEPLDDRAVSRLKELDI